VLGSLYGSRRPEQELDQVQGHAQEQECAHLLSLSLSLSLLLLLLLLLLIQEPP